MLKMCIVRKGRGLLKLLSIISQHTVRWSLKDKMRLDTVYVYATIYDLL